jgi:hypothetical protein
MRYLRGQKQAYSRPVYGYDNVDGRLYEMAHEQAVIERIKGLRGEKPISRDCRAAE